MVNVETEPLSSAATFVTPVVVISSTIKLPLALMAPEAVTSPSTLNPPTA